MLFAQSPGGTNCPPPPPKDGGQMREKMNLPPELRERIDAAREKAMQDPAVQELKKKADSSVDEFRKAMRAAMMKADPELAEIMKAQMEKDRGGKDGKRGEPPGLANLSEGDRQKLKTAHEKAMSDPAVVAAEAKKAEAKTPEERHAAMEAFHQAMKAALLKADPTLGPILDQIKPPKGPPPPKPDVESGT